MLYSTVLIKKANTLRKILKPRIKIIIFTNFQALHGYGVDRHLLGLRLIAKEKKLPEPALFKDAGYIKSTHFRLSTSQVATKCYGLMSYGPSVENGYSLCYNPRAHDMFFSVGAFKSNKETDPHALGKALEKSLIEMHDLLGKHQKAKL